jgi:hypothetical protein
VKHGQRIRAIERKVPAPTPPIVLVYLHDGVRDPGQPEPPAGAHIIYYDIISRRAV